MSQKISVATVINEGGREGRSKSVTGELDVLTSMTKKKGYTNPEELFAAGFAACYNGAIHFALNKRGLGDLKRSIRCEVSLMKDDPTEEGAAPDLNLAVEIIGEIPELDHDQVVEILEETVDVCPYSKAVKGNIAIKVTAK